ncbi:Fic family protein [Paraburkholderia phytofirmans]|uniref:Fido domain-containing protein n=3 Tax=Paraburkholderia phytofirmans TaxID=261302 RepID=B2T0P1_PARPJ|nr:Fic family protein [Paraburkholderia phytofirmans]ACD15343.1 conserved hypothetical protein [Paraburkholderia phytofirmans PsJN]
MTLFTDLGFKWDRAAILRDIPTHSIRRVCFRFHRMLPEFVWDASALEGNPFMFTEVKTLLDGVAVGGRRISDQNQVLNLIETSKYLLAIVQNGRFALDKATYCALHGPIARQAVHERGVFQEEGKTRYAPLPTLPGAPELNRLFAAGTRALTDQVSNAFERGCAFFLFGALQQFFFDGNKRTSRFMMNGVLMANGIDAISVPAQRAADFNEKMVRFYLSKDGTEMMAFLLECHPGE